VYLGAALMATLLAFAGLVVWQERDRRLRAAAEHVAQLSGVITRSTRFAMLQARPDYVHNIIQDVARQENIDRVRIFNKEARSSIPPSPPRSASRSTARPRDACNATEPSGRSKGCRSSSARAFSRPRTGGACSRAWR
jgi:hypothetical protein